MLQLRMLGSPTVDVKGGFRIPMTEFGRIIRDVLERLITGAGAPAGAPTINITNTEGFAVGQIIRIRDSAANEELIIQAVTAGVSLTTTTNLVNAYTVARGATVTVVDRTVPLNANSPAAATAIFTANTAGFAAGQVVVVEDSVGAEFCVLAAVVAGVQLTATANLVNTYNVARGARVTLAQGNQARVSVQIHQPYSADIGGAGLGSDIFGVAWFVGVNVIVPFVQYAEAGAGPALPFAWNIATTASLAGIQFAAIADGE